MPDRELVDYVWEMIRDPIFPLPSHAEKIAAHVEAETLRRVRAAIEALRPPVGHDQVDAEGLCLRCIERHAIDDVLAVVDAEARDA